MNERERAELERLKQRLESLRREFELLWMQAQQLEERLNLSQETAATTSLEARPLEMTRLTAPSLEVSGDPAATLRVEPPTVPATPSGSHQPPPLPPVIAPQPAPRYASKGVEGQTYSAPSATEGATTASSPPPPPLPSRTAPAMAGESSFEMRLGTVWLVRIGIVMVLTSLVFFGNYAYQKFIIQLGPPGKVILMYLGSGVLLGLGAWLQRRQESLKNYAQVLFAGGLAAVYFTTYAAHHLEPLRVIASGRLDGLLLLAWAGFMAWRADRTKSELLALFAVGLAYYTSIITNIGLFTLYSNLVLTAAGVFFLVRNRWATLSFASLLATYGGYAYWRFYVAGRWLWHLDLSAADFQLGNLFLLGYWLLFSAAVFLSRHEKFSGEPRATFLTINNAAFFGLVVLARLYVQSGSFWKFSLCFGAVLLGLAALAARRLTGEKIVVNSYLTQGLVLVTLGVMTYFTGLQLAIVLAAESVMLLILAGQRQNLLLRIGAFVTAALSAGWATFGMEPFDRTDLFLGAFVGLLLVFNAFWSRRRDADADESHVRPQPAYFSALALVTWLATTCNNTRRENLPLALAGETVLLTLSFYSLRVREITIFGQGYLLLAQAVWLLGALYTHSSRPWWNPVLVIVITLGLSHWWQRQQTLKLDKQGSRFLQGLYALAVVGLLFFWLQPRFNAPDWLGFTGLLAVGLTIYGVATGAWLLAACGQIFLVIGGWEFARQLWETKPEWYLALAPMAALGVLSFGVHQWFDRKPESRAEWGESILPIALLYRWVALLMSLGWVHEYIPAGERVWVLASAGAVSFWWSGWRKNPEGFLFSAVWTAVGFGLFWFPVQGESPVSVPNLLAILLLLGQERLARRLPENFGLKPEWLTVMIVLGGVSLWRFVSQWVVLLQSEGFYLTVAWAGLALALFLAGLLLKERTYRWLGLGVLGCALGRVMILDVWKLETLYRILSFMALGIVLLVLGFIYNKYQERIKEWL